MPCSHRRAVSQCVQLAPPARGSLAHPRSARAFPLPQGAIAHFVVKAPMVIGHESAGQVVGVGPGVDGFEVGDRVAMEPGVPCWHHPICRQVALVGLGLGCACMRACACACGWGWGWGWGCGGSGEWGEA